MPSVTFSSSQFYLPDTLRHWPWARQLNPAYASCKEGSSTWTESFRALPPAVQEKFNLCDFNLLGALMFPQSDFAVCRISCDLMNFGFMFDKFLDAGDARTAKRQADIIMHALRNPLRPRPEGEWVVGEMARQFAENAYPYMSDIAKDYFIDAFQRYTDSVVIRNRDKDRRHIRGIEEYLTLRRDTLALKSVFALFLIDIDIPEEVLNQPYIRALEKACLDMVIISNDLCSYNVEQARDDDLHNIVTLAMHELNKNLDQSLRWVGDLHDQLVDSFLWTAKAIPSSGDAEFDGNVMAYVNALGNCVRAHDSWCFEGEKYFGKNGSQIQKSRLVDLLPRRRKSQSA